MTTPVEKSKSRSTLRSFVLNNLGNGCSPLAMFAVSVLLAQNLGVSARGDSAAIVAPYLLAVAAGTFGLPEAATYFVAGRRISVRKMLVLGLIGSVAGGAVAIVATLGAVRGLYSGLGAELFHYIFICMLAVGPLLFLGIVRGIVSGRGWWGLVAGERAVGAVCRLVGVLALIASDALDAGSAAIMIAYAPIVGLLVYALSICRMIRSKGVVPEELVAKSPTIVSYSGRVWLGSITGILLLRLDQLLVGPLSDTYQLGLYVVAVNVSEVLLILSNSVREVAFTRFSSADGPGSAAATSRVLGVISWLLAGVLIAILYPTYGVIFGQQYASSAGLMVVMVVAVTLGVPGSIAGAGLSASGRPGQRSLSLLVACVFNVVMLVCLVPLFGAWGAVLGTLAGNCIAANMNIYLLVRVDESRFRDYYLPRRSDFMYVRGML